MSCTHEDLEDGIRVIHLAGRMDSEGIDRIALQFTVAATTGGKAVVVDLSGVDFLASLGIGTIVSVARSVQNRKGRMALSGPNPQVLSTLERTQIPNVIPTYREFAEARAALASPSA